MTMVDSACYSWSQNAARGPRLGGLAAKTTPRPAITALQDRSTTRSSGLARSSAFAEERHAQASYYGTTDGVPVDR